MSNTIFRICGFSTHNESFSPISIMKQFFNSTICKNISQIKESHIEFDHTLKDNTSCHITFVEINDLDKSTSYSNFADTLIIFIDLEKEKIIEKLEEIIFYIKENFNLSKKIYLLGLYTQNNKPQKTEEAITEYLDTTQIIYDYLELDSESNEDLVNFFDFITQEAIEEKAKQKSKEKDLPEYDMSKSKGICIIY